MVLEQLIMNGIIAGGIYSLIAIGFNMTWSLLRFLNIAHGTLFMLGAYFGFVFVGTGMWIGFALLLAMGSVALVNIAIDKAIFRPLRSRKASSLMLLLASLGVFIFFENLVIAIFGAEVRTIRTGPIQQGIVFLNAIITPIQIVIIVVSIITFILLYVFLKYTRVGKALRATADNNDVAQTIGINVEKMTTYTFAIGGALAALAGVLIGMEQNLEPTMGLNAIIKGFTGGVVGGIGSIQGAIAGGFLLGLVENIGIWFLPSGYKDAIAFVVLIVFLLFRPKGIFGRGEI